MVTFGSFSQVSSFSGLGVCGHLLCDLVDVFFPSVCSLSSQPNQLSRPGVFLLVCPLHAASVLSQDNQLRPRTVEHIENL